MLCFSQNQRECEPERPLNPFGSHPNRRKTGVS
jgi:hypothetical protein